MSPKNRIAPTQPYPNLEDGQWKAGLFHGLDGKRGRFAKAAPPPRGNREQNQRSWKAPYNPDSEHRHGWPTGIIVSYEENLTETHEYPQRDRGEQDAFPIWVGPNRQARNYERNQQRGGGDKQVFHSWIRRLLELHQCFYQIP